MTKQTATIVSKVWNYCNLLRDDGISYGDYLEQLTYLLFLKMADEYSKPPYSRETIIPDEFSWDSLTNRSGSELESHYVKLLRELGKHKGMLGQIFLKAQNKIQDPAKLYKLIHLINDETWVALGTDVKGDIYEGLLEKNAADTKSGAGQYFTPRALIRAMVEVMKPEPMKTMADPACGTGGFFLAYHDYLNIKFNLNREQKEFLKFNTFKGWEIVPNTSRLCLMNLFLHNIGDFTNKNTTIERDDSLTADNGERFDFVLTNPPFGKKSSITITAGDGTQKREVLTYNRQDFWATTSNKQLNFLQHIRTMLKIDGKAAVVLPDNIFFDFNKSTLKPESYTELNKLVRFMNDNPEVNIEISGHTDNVGKTDYNMNLSRDRAKTVAEYIISKIKISSRVQYKGYGATKPVDSNDSEEGRSRNRRVEFKIIDN